MYYYILISDDKHILGMYTDEDNARNNCAELEAHMGVSIDIYEYLRENIDL